VLTQTDIDFVIEKLKGKVFGNGRVWFEANVQIQAYLDDLPFTADTATLAKAAIKMATANEGRKYPGALEAILEGIDPQLDTNVARILVSVQAFTVPVAAPGVDHLAAEILAHKCLFWNRRLLRSKLQSIIPAAGNNVLVINGKTGSGKSYTVQMLTHLNLTQGQFVLAAVRPPLDAGAKSDAIPESLAPEIVTAMGLVPDEAKLSEIRRNGLSMNQFADRICRWLLAHLATQSDTVYWIVLDGFGLEGVDEWCRAFISRLANKIAAGAYRTRLRLILIHYPVDELASIKDNVEEELIQDPEESDYRSVVASALKSHNLQFKDEDVDQTIKEARARVAVPPTDPKFQGAMNRVLKEILNVG
jgi:energy-coupling factor transporter ATP-binding protein EcfA2